MLDLLKNLIPKLKDTDGRYSVSFTMLFVSFNLVMIWLGMFIFQGYLGFKVPDFEGANAMTVLGPIIALYFFRRWSRERVCDKNSDNEGR